MNNARFYCVSKNCVRYCCCSTSHLWSYSASKVGGAKLNSAVEVGGRLGVGMRGGTVGTPEVGKEMVSHPGAALMTGGASFPTAAEVFNDFLLHDLFLLPFPKYVDAGGELAAFFTQSEDLLRLMSVNHT